MELANRIRKIRENFGYTQAEIAYKAGISPQAYSKIERRAATAKYETLQKVANALGVDLLYMLDINNN